MAAVEKLLTDHLYVWTAAIKRKSTAGRGSSSKIELYGIKKLRELILELAVRGLLVPQDSSDEPASELLKTIAAEKANLVKAGKIRKEKPLSPIGEEEKPFAAPRGWEWVRIADIGYDFGQKTPDEHFTYIDVGSIDNRLGLIDSPAILSADEAPSRARKLVKHGTVIYSTVRPYLLNIAIVQEDFDPDPIASTAFAVVHPFENVSSGYIYRYLRSPSFVSYVESVQTGIAYPAINDRQFFSGLLPLPPTDEQDRIVAKIDELMALCDQLEQRTDASFSVHQTLVETLLNALTRAADHAQFANAWQRIAEHFDTLFATEESIDQFKQTILQLAVMGKLVPQDPNDEPASELLKKIAAEKAKLVKDGKIKKEKPQSPIADNEKPFKCPVGWEFCRLQETIDVRDGTHDSPKDAAGDKTYPLVTSKNFINGEIDFDSARRISEEDHLEISRRSLVDVEDILFSMIGGNIGNQVMVRDPRPFSVKNVAIFKYFLKSATNPHFIYLYTQELAAELQYKASGGAQPFVSLGFLRNLVVALPPKAEQQRIVAKVDELMVLCDQLEVRMNDAKTTQLHLADAMVEKALARV